MLLRLGILVCSIFALLVVSESSEARRKPNKSKKQEVELKTPERMAGYAELMRLKPAAREKYLRGIQDMLVRMTLLPSRRGRMLVVDASPMSTVEYFERVTWLQLIFPQAFAAGPAVNCDSGAEGKMIPIKKMTLRASNCDPNNAQDPCGQGKILVNTGDKAGSPFKCVDEGAYFQAVGSQVENDWKTSSQGVCEGYKAKANVKSANLDKAGMTCVYAGWVQKTNEKGDCPRPPQVIDLGNASGERGRYIIQCEDPNKYLCNPSIYGVVKEANPGSGAFYGVCIDPSPTATRDCRALARSPGENQTTPQQDDIDGTKPPGQSAPKGGAAGADPFKDRRANKDATTKLFASPYFADEFNKTSGEFNELCNNKQQTLAGFCEECQSMVAQMSAMNGTAGLSGAAIGPGGNGGMAQ